MKTVFVVDVGEYSDNHVDSIWATKAQAEKYLLKKIRPDDYHQRNDYNITEWVVNSSMSRVMTAYSVGFQKDGSIVNVDVHGIDAISKDYKPAVYAANTGIMYANVAAKTEDQAKKIACDLRAEHLAEKAGIS